MKSLLQKIFEWFSFTRKRLYISIDLNPVDWFSIRSLTKEKGNRKGIKFLMLTIYITTYNYDFNPLISNLDRFLKPDDLYIHLGKKKADRAAKTLLLLTFIILALFILIFYLFTFCYHALLN